jgi:hypothetical protein
MVASKIIELEEQLQEARVHLEQQMNLVSTQQEELSQLQIRLENSTAIKIAMGNNAIRKDDAIEEARQLTAQTIEALEESVGQLTQELAETKDRLVAAQTIDLEVHTRENAQRERLQAKLIQERQTIVSLEAEVDRMKIELEEIQRAPPPQTVPAPVHLHVDEEQLRRMDQENQEHQKTIDLLRREVHRKDQRFWEEEANAPPSSSLFRTYET